MRSNDVGELPTVNDDSPNTGGQWDRGQFMENLPDKGLILKASGQGADQTVPDTGYGNGFGDRMAMGIPGMGSGAFTAIMISSGQIGLKGIPWK